MPYYNWQCLSIQLPNRNVDLVIDKESDMDMLLKFMINSLRTVDGQRGTADKILNNIQKEGESEVLKKSGNKIVLESVKHLIK